MLPAGTVLDVTVSFLSMDTPPEAPAAALPEGMELRRAEAPPVWYFLSLYQAVGANWEWTDKLEEDPTSLATFVSDPAVELWTLMGQGWPHGFFQLDFRDTDTVDLAYFGLVPEAVGRGLGKILLQTALSMAWARPATKRVTVNTCTLDHPAALSLYKSVGFAPERTMVRQHKLRADRLAPLAQSA